VSPPDPSPRFRTTRWSLVVSASNSAREPATAALAELCEIYWYPLYAFLRREGTAEDDALDLVHGFLARLLDKRDLAAVPARGRFRSYLLGALQHYVANQRRAERAAVRGGDGALLSLDDAEVRYQREPAHDVTPKAMFERRWALTILERALGRLEQEYTSRGRGALFAELEHTLNGAHAGTATYAETARLLGISESAVKVTVHRLRARMRELIRDEIAQTIASDDAADVDDELALLFAAISD